MNLEEKVIKSEKMFDGRVFNVYVNRVVLPDGRESTREIVEHNGGVAIVAFEGEYVYLVRQFRSAVKKEILEIPAGKIEKGEDPYDCGIRELEEELGLKADKITSLGKIYPTPGYCSEIIYIYFADKFVKTKQKLDDGEFLNVEKMKISDALKMIENGDICDGKTVAGIYKAISFLNK